jgi:hypothetical protein
MTAGATNPLATAAEITAAAPNPQATSAASARSENPRRRENAEQPQEHHRHRRERDSVHEHVDPGLPRGVRSRHETLGRGMEGHHGHDGQRPDDEQNPA